MNKRHPTAAQTPEELLQDLRALVTDAEAMLGDSVKEHSTEAVDAIRARFEAAQERLGRMYSDTRKKIVAGAHYADETIHEHPYQSLAIAAGLGVLVGVLLSRNSR